MRQVRELVARVAPTEARVLITGESGTGKELVATAIHAASRRSDRAFVTVNCAAIPRDLVESEMFGHEKGSFTGATERRLGRFELAHGGTLFLDEIGDLSAEAKPSFCGRSKPASCSASAPKARSRWTCGSGGHEPAAGRRGERRQLPRRPVLPTARLPHSSAAAAGASGGSAGPGRLSRGTRTPAAASVFTPAAIDALAAYNWPGNVRELANLVERLSILAGPTVEAHDVRAVLRGDPPPPAAVAAAGRPLNDALDDFERAVIAAALAQARGNVAEAARALRTDRANLYRRMRRLGLDKRDE